MNTTGLGPHTATEADEFSLRTRNVPPRQFSCWVGLLDILTPTQTSGGGYWLMLDLPLAPFLFPAAAVPDSQFRGLSELKLRTCLHFQVISAIDIHLQICLNIHRSVCIYRPIYTLTDLYMHFTGMSIFLQISINFQIWTHICWCLFTHWKISLHTDSENMCGLL